VPYVLPKEVVAGLKSDLEDALISGRWCGAVKTELAEKWGTTTRTVHARKVKLEQEWRDAAKIKDIEAERAGWLSRCRRAQEQAAREGNLRALASLLQIESRVLGLEAPQRLELSGRLELSPVRQLTDEELDARLSESDVRREIIPLRVVGDTASLDNDGWE
jgi:hypothetical protein